MLYARNPKIWKFVIQKNKNLFGIFRYFYLAIKQFFIYKRYNIKPYKKSLFIKNHIYFLWLSI